MSWDIYIYIFFCGAKFDFFDKLAKSLQDDGNVVKSLYFHHATLLRSQFLTLAPERKCHNMEPKY